MKLMFGIICAFLFVGVLFSNTVLAQEEGYRVEIKIVHNVVNKKDVGDLIEDIIRNHNEVVKSMKLIGKFQEYEHPAYAELHQLAHHTKMVNTMRLSKFVPGLEYGDSDELFICPRCGLRSPQFEHGNAYECECGLRFQAYGNGLYLWEEKH